jgi:hypothetical protein
MTLDRDLAEIEAESVAFVVCDALGIDTAAYSMPAHTPARRVVPLPPLPSARRTPRARQARRRRAGLRCAQRTMTPSASSYRVTVAGGLPVASGPLPLVVAARGYRVWVRDIGDCPPPPRLLPLAPPPQFSGASPVASR